MRLLIAIAAAIWAAPANAASISCPIGTDYEAKVVVTKRYWWEGCRNFLMQRDGPFRMIRSTNGTAAFETTFRDGRQNGVHRSYDDTGLWFMETTYEDGRETSERFNPEAVKQEIEKINAAARASGRKVKITLLDEHTIDYEYIKPAWWSRLLLFSSEQERQDRARQKFLENTDFCSIFDLEVIPIDRAQLHVIDANGKPIFETTFHKNECTLGPVKSPST